jgi:hypothetical protein
MGNNPVFAVTGMVLPMVTRLEQKTWLTNPNCDRTVFFILFRECLETTVVISVLLAFLKQTLGGEADKKTYKKLVKQASHFCYITIPNARRRHWLTPH